MNSLFKTTSRTWLSRGRCDIIFSRLNEIDSFPVRAQLIKVSGGQSSQNATINQFLNCEPNGLRKSKQYRRLCRHQSFETDLD